MKAWVLRSQGKPLKKQISLEDYPDPIPGTRDLIVQVEACGLCRTDLHILEGDIPARKLPLILGHQIVGRVWRTGDQVKKFQIGDRVGIPWLNSVDQSCKFCNKGLENLCPSGKFTGYDVDGGFAEFTSIQEDFAYQLPEGPESFELSPLLCGGVIGFRAFRLSGVSPGENLGLYGFGSSAHIILQLAIKKGIRVFVRSRGNSRIELAKKLGAVWAGDYFSPLPEALQAGIIFAPAGEIIPLALKDLEKGGKLILAGIHMSQIPSFPYQLIYEERMVKSVANSTREDVKDFLREAVLHKIKPEVTLYDFKELPSAFEDLSSGRLSGTGVLLVKGKSLFKREG